MREDRAIKREISSQSSCWRKTTGSSSFVLPPTCWAEESLSYLYLNTNNDNNDHIKHDDDVNELASVEIIVAGSVQKTSRSREDEVENSEII